jgi:hypothetical protein
MGMFDYYEPKPPLACPKCGAVLEGWQGKEGWCGLFEWVQGLRGPVWEWDSETHKPIPESERAKITLTEDWIIDTGCCCGTSVDAIASFKDGIWTHTNFLAPLEPPGIPDDWHLMRWDEREDVLAELQHEISVGHVLYGRRMTPLARHSGHDRVLIRTIDAVAPLYVVYLTWQIKSDPTWPRVQAFSNLTEFVEKWEF